MYKFILILFSLLLYSCSNNKKLFSGNWEYINENGRISNLTVENNRWISDYCSLRFEEDEIWGCNQINAKIKVRSKKYVKLIFGDSWRNEWVKYKIVEFNDEKFILQKFSRFKGWYEVEYVRKIN